MVFLRLSYLEKNQTVSFLELTDIVVFLHQKETSYNRQPFLSIHRTKRRSRYFCCQIENVHKCIFCNPFYIDMHSFKFEAFKFIDWQKLRTHSIIFKQNVIVNTLYVYSFCFVAFFIYQYHDCDKRSKLDVFSFVIVLYHIYYTSISSLQ